MVRINRVLANTTTLLQPGSLPPVDLFPCLMYILDRFLGKWRHKVNETRKMMNELYSRYFDLVAKRRKDDGSMEPFADRLIQQ